VADETQVVGRRLLAGSLAPLLLLGLGWQLFTVDRSASGTALRWAISYQPQARWSVVRQSLEPWASDVKRGTFRRSGGAWPAWVIELSAPSDSKFATYSAVITLNAITGQVFGASVLASGEP
jgi:hypothetical protein